MKEELQKARENYTMDALALADADENPFEQFKTWFLQYKKVAERDYNAMVLSTSSPVGRPTSRVVLLKGVDKGGFEFYTNYESTKGQEIAKNPYVALNFYWPELERQVRIEGIAVKMTTQESQAYFKSRPIESQIGAIASPQSSVISGREVLEQKVEELQSQKATEIEMPAYWGGYRVMPSCFEFWQGRTSRLHDRIQYIIESEAWVKQRLAP